MAAGEVARLARIDPREAHACGRESQHHRPLISPGGFEHDEAAMRRLREAGERGRRSPDPAPLAGREGEDIDPVPGDIDAEDISWQAHGTCP